MKEYRAVMSVDKTIDQVKSIILNIETYPDWQHHCAETRFIEQPDENTIISYIHTSSPWPAADRDLVVKLTGKSEKQDNFRLSFTAVDGFVPPKKPRVRMTYMKGFWELDKLDNGKVRIIHQVHADPGGGVPDFLVNAAVVDTPYKTMSNLRDQLN